MPIYFNPTDVQAIGIGLAAFLSTLLATYVFLSARHERIGRSLFAVLAASVVWSAFGFLYHIIPDIGLARDMRVMSVMGIVWLSMTHVNFSDVYFRERGVASPWSSAARMAAFVVGAVFTALLLFDLFGTYFVVGALTLPPALVLAPNAGPFMAFLIVYYCICVGISGVLFAARARLAAPGPERRQVEWLFASAVVGLFLGATRFTPWYGFDFYPLVGSLGFPLFVFAVFYSMKRYHLFNLEVAAAQLLVFALWSFTFFRVLLDQTLRAAIPDIALFVAVLVLGVLLLRSIVMEGKAQRELALMTIDRGKSEFVTIAAHQLRTPLSAVRWSLDLLLTNPVPLTKDQRDIAERGSRAAGNMTLLVNDLLNVSRINDGTFGYAVEQGDLRDAATVAVNALQDAAAGKHITLSLDVPQSAVPANFDRGKLAIALENIIDNAIKYSRDGSPITVSVSELKDSASISVSDSGIGISAADQSRLFEKFFRGKDAVRMFTDGSGLGLFIAKTIVEGHRGKLTIASEVGKGTLVTLTLPRQRSV